MKTLLLDDNLMSQTRVEAQLRAAGCDVTTRRRWMEGGWDFVLVNLGSRPLGGLELLETARREAPEAILWGFCGHLEVEIRRAALQVGVQKLLTNDQAMSQLAPIVTAQFGPAISET